MKRIATMSIVFPGVLFLAGCGQSPQAPSEIKSTSVAVNDGSGVTSHADGDVKAGSGALDLVRLRMDRQTSSGESILRQYALPGQTYPMAPGETIELWAEYSGVNNPRFFVNWGEGDTDFVNCGSCLMKHTYARPGVYTVVVKLDDRVSTTVTRTFVLNAFLESASKSGTFCNPGLITINDNVAATPFPSSISVSGLSGSISSVTATLRGYSHTFHGDLGVFLTSPAGNGLMIMNRTGGGGAGNNADLTFQDGASAIPNANIGPGSFTFGPTGGSNPGFPGPFGANFTTFNGSGPNGTWNLFVRDQAGADIGQFAGGWCVTITTTGASSTGVSKASADYGAHSAYPNDHIMNYPFQKPDPESDQQ